MVVVEIMSERQVAERIVAEGGVSIFPDGALVRDTFSEVFEVSESGECECGRNRCQHSIAVEIETGRRVAA